VVVRMGDMDWRSRYHQNPASNHLSTNLDLPTGQHIRFLVHPQSDRVLKSGETVSGSGFYELRIVVLGYTDPKDAQAAAHKVMDALS
jgi:hypothetical protein